MRSMVVPCADLAGDSSIMREELRHAFESVLDGGLFILASEVASFERSFAKYCGAPYAIGVDNGTTALMLLMKSFGIGAGDEVITAPNSFLASASSVAMIGASPVFSDIGPDLNLDPKKIEAAITPRTKAIMPVHLAGRPARMTEIEAIAKKHGLLVFEDAAQSVGARLEGQRVGSFGDGAAFSLHPLKNLHAFGDGGVITVHAEKHDTWLRKARNHGLVERNTCEFFSPNARLDELQAAFLNVQLRHLDQLTEIRRAKAARYHEALRSVVAVPQEHEGEYCVYQTYIIRAPRRDELFAYLLENGIEARINYPVPIHLQPAAKYLRYAADEFPETTRATAEILSLPLYPSLSEARQELVIETVLKFYESEVRLPRPTI